MAHLVGAERVTVEVPGRVVLDDLSIGLERGDRIGVVGRNGEGKSTLLRVLGVRQEPDDGRVTRRGGTTVGMLDQGDALPAGPVLDAVVGGRAEHDWAGDRRVRDVLDGLLAGVDLAADTASLSGGQRRRTALAALLVGDWDVLLLDEPTNHLDLEGVHWLAEHLRTRWPAGQGALVVVSHDRWFLDAACTRMWEVHDGRIDAFEGGYAAYVLQRVERDRQARTMEQRRQNLLRKELAWLRRGAPARTTKPRFRLDAAAELIADVPPPRDRVELSRLAVARLGRDVVDLVDAGAGYGGDPVLEHVDWLVAPGERTGVLGRNGAGKSTLLGLVDGTLAPTSGRVRRGKTVRVRRLSQQLEELVPIEGERVRDVIGRLRTTYSTGAGSELSPGQLLEQLGFPATQLSNRVSELSGGWRRRLQLLLVLLDGPNVLVLDEPTNDLDTDVLTAMEDVLDGWPGTLIVVSHDRYLIERVTDRQVAVLDGRVRDLPGGVDEYLRLSAAAPQPGPAGAQVRPEGRTGGEAPVLPSERTADDAPAADDALSGADRRALEKQVAALDRRLARLADETRRDHDALAAHDQADYVGIGAITARIGARDDERETLEAEWLEAAERLESA